MQAELNRKQSTVFFSDIVGYTRLMGKDENAAFELMKENLELHQEILALYKGKLIKELGDGILAIFESSIDALNASLEIQKRCIQTNRYQLRIGLQSGEVIFDHGDIFGDAVNVASRIQSVCIPSSVVFSDRISREISKERGFQAIKLGGFDLKNVDHTLELYALSNEPLAIPKRADILGNIRYQERNPWKYRIGIAAIVVLLGALIFSVFWDGQVWEKDKSVAVMPFRLVKENKELEYLEDGLTENVIDQLSKIGSIKTIAYETMKNYKGSEALLDSVAKQLDVSVVLKGDIEMLNNAMRINLQLVDPINKKNIWEDSFEREGNLIPELQSEIAKAIAQKFDAILSLEESSQIGKGETSNLDAYEQRLQGKENYRTYHSDNLLVAVQQFKKAIELDPNYALAYADLAKTYAQLYYYSPDSLVNLSLPASSKSLSLEPKLSEGYGAQGLANYYLGKVEFAKNSFELALNYSPTQSEALGNIGIVYFSRGDLEQTLKYQFISSDRRPDHYLPYQIVGWICRILGKNEEALGWLNKSLSISKNLNTIELTATTLIKNKSPEDASNLVSDYLKDSINRDPWSLKTAGIVAMYLYDFDLAKSYFEQSIALYPEYRADPFYGVPINLAYIYYHSGEKAKALGLLESVIRSRQDSIEEGMDDYNLFLDLATAYWIKQDRKMAFHYLDKAYINGWRDLFFVESNPIFSNAKSDPEYKRIIGQINTYLSDLNARNLDMPLFNRER
ncbi:hypothetical protein J0A67_09275 [Algoriphagus aestuariicola]|uniref:Guanylate cyclase domain-containing protein n=1 Tax=Algoriphagus aestuariicola TaxID=1852016 RepID=A0ABS3BPU5_9BACT|nr:adenylate/guanylate cyclase domain-containing protein [Algoriphagus aestuariicola]MBN7801052.1 hypothetical protein [Algoriphagus aestuariicola]